MWANNGDTWVQIDDVSVTDDVPAVVSSSPVDGAVDVPVSGNIVVTFTTNKVRFATKGLIVATISWSLNNTVRLQSKNGAYL